MTKDVEYYKRQLQMAIEELAHKEAIVLTLRAKIENMHKYIDKSFQNRNKDEDN
jgi:hypothetical protein